MNDSFWMNEAYKLALQAQELQEIPVGALVVYKNDIIGKGYNLSRTTCDPTAHAEIIALRQAAHSISNYRLLNTVLYVTLEPCVMCAGALVQARISRLVFASRDFKSGAAGSVVNYLRGFPFNHQVNIDEGIMHQQCSELLSNFFKKNRG